MEPITRAPEQQKIRQRLVSAMVDDLHQEPDEKTALRKALCMLMVLQDDTDPDVGVLVTYLLVRFEPLASHFQENRHPLIAEAECIRTPRHGKTDATDSEAVGLLINCRQMEKVLERNADLATQETGETGASDASGTNTADLPKNLETRSR